MAKAFGQASRLARDPEPQQSLERVLDRIEPTTAKPTRQQMREDLEQMKNVPGMVNINK
jgi:hypothetical protein